MKKIRTRTGILIILAFTIMAFSLSFGLSRWAPKSEWHRFRIEYPERAIRANLRQVVLAASVYLRSHHAEKVTYTDLLQNGQIIDRPIDPVLGEDYHTICLSRTDTKVEVVTKDGRTVTCEFGILGVSSIGPNAVALPPADDLNVYRDTQQHTEAP